MRHGRALLIKFISYLVLLYIVLGVVDDISFGNIFLISVVLTAAEYVIGDLFVLPRTNNTIASLADLGLALAVIWAMTESMTYAQNNFFPSLITSVMIGLYEYFYHKYFVRDVLSKESNTSQRQQGQMQFQTEASEEIHPDRPKDNRSQENRSQENRSQENKNKNEDT